MRACSPRRIPLCPGPQYPSRLPTSFSCYFLQYNWGCGLCEDLLSYSGSFSCTVLEAWSNQMKTWWLSCCCPTKEEILEEMRTLLLLILLNEVYCAVHSPTSSSAPRPSLKPLIHIHNVPSACLRSTAPSGFTNLPSRGSIGSKYPSPASDEGWSEGKKAALCFYLCLSATKKTVWPLFFQCQWYFQKFGAAAQCCDVPGAPLT